MCSFKIVGKEVGLIWNSRACAWLTENGSLLQATGPIIMRKDAKLVITAAVIRTVLLVLRFSFFFLRGPCLSSTLIRECPICIHGIPLPSVPTSRTPPLSDKYTSQRHQSSDQSYYCTWMSTIPAAAQTEAGEDRDLVSRPISAIHI